MAYSIPEADAYISQNVIDIDDWTETDEGKKQRLLTKAGAVLRSKYVNLTIPDAAVFEFAAVLAVVFNDTYKMQRYGVKQLSVKGMSFSFAGDSAEYEQWIPGSAVVLIEEANAGTGPKPKNRRIGRSVR